MHVYLSDMQKESAECPALINETANAIDDDILKLLFVSVQQNNLDLCIKYAVQRFNRIVHVKEIKGTEGLVILIVEILAWFPHIWTNWNYEKAQQAAAYHPGHGVSGPFFCDIPTLSLLTAMFPIFDLCSMDNFII